jgi:hypothetical protein
MHRYELSLGAMKPSTRGDWVMYEDVEAEIEKARQEARSEMLAAYQETINALVDVVNELREKHG